jgi:molybdenum cofactor cytidylyltransferase
MNQSIGIILLAAGSSSRMGQSKQLLPIAGEPLLKRSARVAISSGAEHVVVVTGSDSDLITKAISDLSLHIINNPDWKLGMGKSLKTGLTSLLDRAPDTGAVLVMVCDQPELTSEHLSNLILSYHQNKNPVVASAYANTLAVPALFDRSLFSELLSLGDEEGARQIIRKYAGRAASVPFAGGATDLDTPEDYQHFIHP